MTISRREVLGGAALAVVLNRAGMARSAVSSEDAREIFKEAYIYGFPIVDSYRIQYAYFVDPNSPEFKALWNELKNLPRVFTPKDVTVQTANSDTPYSMLGLDLRAEPMVLTVPKIEKGRYFSIQMIDAYTFNFDYAGRRTTGNDGGNYMIAGPGWNGETPPGIDKVFRCETDLALCTYRTQLFNPADLDNVKQVQAGYDAKPLSVFLGNDSVPSAPAVEFIAPLSPEGQRSSPEFFAILNFMLQFCPTHPSETGLISRFASVGIGAGRTFDAEALSPELRRAAEDGMADAWAEFQALKARIDAGEVKSRELFGTREAMKNDYLRRMAGAVIGIYGNSQEEAMYPIYSIDSEGKVLDGNNKYTIRFAADLLPPVFAFWSLTMYKLPESLLYDNPIDRYLINSPMLPDLRKDEDGGVTLLIQHESPNADWQSNWLPAPKGPFFMAMRLYWPKPEALDGSWTAPLAQPA